MSPSRSRLPRPSPGFTLVEVLVALLLSTIVGGAVVALVLRQNEFYVHHGEATYAGQTARAAADLLSTELQMSGPGDLLAAAPDSVSIRFDTYRAVVCTADPLLDQATLFVFDSVSNANLPGSLGYAVSAPGDSAYHYADGWGPTVTLAGTFKTACTSRGAPDLPEGWRYRLLTGWSASGLGGVPERGSLVRRYGRLTYRFGASRFGPGSALWRNSQELAAPFDSATVAFQYVVAGGDTVSAPASLAATRAVRVTGTAVGGTDDRVDARRELDVTVWLRNDRFAAGGGGGGG